MIHQINRTLQKFFIVLLSLPQYNANTYVCPYISIYSTQKKETLMLLSVNSLSRQFSCLTNIIKQECKLYKI